jgi:hypothetical protein
MSNPNAIVPVTASAFAVATMNRQELAEIFDENLGGGSLDISALDRVKVPSGASPFWTVPSLEGDKPQTTIDGIIVYFRDNKAMWVKSQEESGGGSSPDCTGRLIPIDEAGSKVWQGRGVRWEGDTVGPHDCGNCPFDQFGSSDKGAGKKCKDTRMLGVLMQDSVLPMLVNVPPTSLAIIRKFFTQLLARRIPFYGVRVSIGLNKTKNKAGTDYCEVTLSVLETLSPEIREQVKSYVEMIRPALERVEVDAPAKADGAGSSFAEDDNLEEIDTTEGEAAE